MISISPGKTQLDNYTLKRVPTNQNPLKTRNKKEKINTIHSRVIRTTKYIYPIQGFNKKEKYK